VTLLGLTLLPVLGSAMTEPDKGGSDVGLPVTVVVILAIVGLCLWLLFRRGSISDRAEIDVPIDESPATSSGDGLGDEPDPSAS